ALVTLNVDFSSTPDFQIQPLRERIYDRDPDSVQSPGNLIRRVVKLPTRVKLSQHDFCGRSAFLWHNFRRYTPAVVDDSNRVIDVNNNVNFSAKAGQCLVNGVVDYFVD